MFTIRSVCVCVCAQSWPRRGAVCTRSVEGGSMEGGRVRQMVGGHVIYSYKSGNVMNHPSLSCVIMSFVMTS